MPHGTAGRAPRAQETPDISDLGIVAASGAALFAGRFVLAQTWLSFHRGGAGASYAPGLDGLGAALLAVGILWVALVGGLRACHRRPIGPLDRWLLCIILTSALLCAIPGEDWRLATVRLGGAGRAPREWVVAAAARGELRVLDYLLAHGANADARAANGQTALGAAAAAGQHAACERLIAGGAAVNERMESTGQTALMEAAEEGRSDVVRLLLAHGAGTAPRDAAGLTAEDWAAIDDDKPMLALLRAPQLGPRVP
jgi:ankyrin repeat protein